MSRRTFWPFFSIALMALLLAGCESRRLKEENAALKQQVDSLTQDRDRLQAKQSETTRSQMELSTRVDALTKDNDQLKKQLEAATKPKGKTKAKKASARTPAKTRR